MTVIYRTLCRRLMSMAVVLAAAVLTSRAGEDHLEPRDARSAVPSVPELRIFNLPAYVLNIDLDPQRRIVDVTQQVHWTNPGSVPTSELVFQVIPNNRPSTQTIEAATLTLESLRIDPRTALDERSKRFCLHQIARGSTALKACFSNQNDTHLHVALDQPVNPFPSNSYFASPFLR